MPFCLLPQQIDAFKKALKEKELTVTELLNAPDSQSRINLLKEYVGDAASDVNILFEEKLLLKNRVIGIENWLKKMTESGKYSKKELERLAQIKSEYRAAQTERLLNPSESQTFLSDLVEKKFGISVSREQTAEMFRLSSLADEAKSKYDFETSTWASEEARKLYVKNKFLYNQYYSGLKNPELKVSKMLGNWKEDVQQKFKENPALGAGKVLGDTIGFAVDTAQAALSTWDNSFMGRQGIITLLKSPKVWWKMSTKSFSDIYKVMSKNDVEGLLLEELMSSPNGMDGLYNKLVPRGLEEQFPTDILNKIPGLGRTIKASATAFNNSALRARFGLFDAFVEAAKKSGKELSPELVDDMSNHILAITARGKVGKTLGSPLVRRLMWAPKMLKADWDILTAHTFGAGLKTNYMKKQALETITRVVTATAASVVIAEAMGFEVEKDFRSSKAMSVKVGNTYFKIPFPRGMVQIVTLLTRMSMGLMGKEAYKTTSGELKKLNTGQYGQTTVFDVGMDFLVNKLNPFSRTTVDLLRGRNIKGEKPTPESILLGFTPISFQNAFEIKDEATAESILGVLLDIFGVNSTTYTQNLDTKKSDSTTVKPPKVKASTRLKSGKMRNSKLKL